MFPLVMERSNCLQALEFVGRTYLHGICPNEGNKLSKSDKLEISASQNGSTADAIAIGNGGGAGANHKIHGHDAM